MKLWLATFLSSITLMICGCDLGAMVEPSLPLSPQIHSQPNPTGQAYNAPQKRLRFSKAMINKKIGDSSFYNPLHNPFAVKALSFQSTDSQVASINSQGEVKIHGIGTTLITARLRSAQKQQIAAASYWLNVNQSPQQPLKFLHSELSKSIGDGVFNNPLIGGSGKGSLRYRSSNPLVAMIDKHSGEIQLVSPGVTLIQAVKNQDDYFLSANSQFLLNVSEAAAGRLASR